MTDSRYMREVQKQLRDRITTLNLEIDRLRRTPIRELEERVQLLTNIGAKLVREKELDMRDLDILFSEGIISS